ncbi:sodium:proton antiporter [Millionella massiliensis]|uniref:sodium:proton antiporter n=1 Tax=Millionella massiliensis TaxID=1871023 RepID=UPI0023A7B445|nr:sodium:proton antiporter [Millionella massiliensis]
MRKILTFSFLLVLGLIASQTLPAWMSGDHYATFKGVTDTLLYICLAFIMINVGREFEVQKEKWRSYVSDYFIAMATAALPWFLVALYYVFILLPSSCYGSWDAWKESLLLSRFAAPTSAGILFTMLAAIGLRSSWMYRKIQVLAIFDDLDTILLMIPLQIMMVGFRPEIIVILAVVTVLLGFGWRQLARYDMRQEWWAILLYAVAVIFVTWLVNRLFHIHIEVLLPAFVLGMVMRHKHIDTPVERKVSTGVSFLFMLLVGLSMPYFAGGGMTAFSAHSVAEGGAPSILGSQPMMPWGTIAFHVVMVSLLSNVGKLVPIFFYRDRMFEERLALSVGMFTRGEVGAGIIFIALGYHIGGPALIISVLTLVFNLILTGGFVVWVKRLAMKAYGKQQSQAM